ncbi:MAG: OmcA/MtrC family decaheme c-type cytochrome [Deltaproteobacteria bacterium]|nr:OmcA/MtrC family decaheme c-type cytochrome [Deltaproteobacteria bacterium]
MILALIRRPATIVVVILAFVGLGAGCDGSGGGGGDVQARVGRSLSGGAVTAAPPSGSESSVETCESCHATGRSVPVGDIGLPEDAHFVDSDPDGPLTASGFRRLDATLTLVDVRGSSVVIEFEVEDETGAGVGKLFASDGRFAIARLQEGVDGDPSEWVNLGSPSTERFTSGLFENLGGGAYRYTSVFDPTGAILDRDTLRVAIQLSASDLPAENAWCDFDADLVSANDCDSRTLLTRDIVQTADCNVCHGPTSDTKLSFHGGGRTDVEYCVTCHNPSGNTDMTLLVHKIHAGAELSNGFRGYSDVQFTKDLDDCAVCHTGGGVDEDNWKEVPSRDACGSCHDDVNFDTGQNHGAGGVQTTNRLCAGCHPAEGTLAPVRLPVATVHLGEARSIEAAAYRGPGSGYAIESVDYSSSTGEIGVIYSVGRNGSRMDLEAAPEWAMGGSLRLLAGWDTEEYANTGSGSTPAQPLRFDALDVGGAVTALPMNRYELVFTPPSSASNTLTIHLEGRPVADLDSDGTLSDRIPVASVFANVSVAGGRSSAQPRREIVDSTLCNECHDSGGAGLSIHGTNRVGEMTVCSVCHNPDATDINQRPDDPSTTPDMKAEESIDFKRMIHQIHAGEVLEEGLVVYGFGGTPHEYGHVRFVGNLANCETCHVAEGYSAEAARAASPSTIDTGLDLADPSDDLNISSTAAVCSSCHDDAVARGHMELYGASFRALDADIR